MTHYYIDDHTKHLIDIIQSDRPTLKESKWVSFIEFLDNLKWYIQMNWNKRISEATKKFEEEANGPLDFEEYVNFLRNQKKKRNKYFNNCIETFEVLFNINLEKYAGVIQERKPFYLDIHLKIASEREISKIYRTIERFRNVPASIQKSVQYSVQQSVQELIPVQQVKVTKPYPFIEDPNKRSFVHKYLEKNKCQVTDIDLPESFTEEEESKRLSIVVINLRFRTKEQIAFMEYYNSKLRRIMSIVPTQNVNKDYIAFENELIIEALKQYELKK